VRARLDIVFPNPRSWLGNWQNDQLDTTLVVHQYVVEHLAQERCQMHKRMIHGIKASFAYMKTWMIWSQSSLPGDPVKQIVSCSVQLSKNNLHGWQLCNRLDQDDIDVLYFGCTQQQDQFSPVLMKNNLYIPTTSIGYRGALNIYGMWPVLWTCYSITMMYF